MSQHNVSVCAQCGVADDHPKVVVADAGDHHHDCLPFHLREQVIAAAGHMASVFEAALNGVRGDALRAHIQAVHGGLAASTAVVPDPIPAVPDPAPVAAADPTVTGA